MVFFIWPASQAIKSSVERTDPFGFKTTFIGLENYAQILADTAYLNALGRTAIFSLSVTLISMGMALLLAVCVNRVLRISTFYTTLLVWPYAVAPVAAGVLWWFLFNPTIGLLPYLLDWFHIDWNHLLSGTQAMILITIAAAWKQVSYNFLFFLAGLQSIPQALVEAAAIDGATPFKRFRNIVLPLLSPTTFFLTIININYVIFDTFGVIDTTTKGGPNQATMTLVYKIYNDGVVGLNIGSSSAQSVMLMGIVILLTFIQFRFIERRVNY